MAAAKLLRHLPLRSISVELKRPRWALANKTACNAAGAKTTT